jgi:septal ring factor EnvC (AmiA/AmiB activator)
MREQLEQRLQELRREFEGGQVRLAELEQKRTSLEQTLLRISGAIQVLEEELDRAAAEQAEAPEAARPPTENVPGKAGTS